MLYDLVTCPHRVTMDLHGDPAKQDAANPFVKLLWEKGSLFEREVIGGLALPFLDLSLYGGEEKERLTLEAMQRSEPLITAIVFRSPDCWATPISCARRPAAISRATSNHAPEKRGRKTKRPPSCLLPRNRKRDREFRSGVQLPDIKRTP
jgi:hypothetical protein